MISSFKTIVKYSSHVWKQKSVMANFRGKRGVVQGMFKIVKLTIISQNRHEILNFSNNKNF